MADDKLAKADDKLARRIKALIDQAEEFADQQKEHRDLALDYYNGKTPDLVPEAGMSAATSKDVRALVKKVIPSLMRTILANDMIGEYEPTGPGQEEQAEQATDYINAVVVPECDAAQAIYDAIFDAVLLKTGILKWSAYERTKAVTSRHTGQSPDALLGLDEIGDVDNVEQAEDGSVSFTLKRRETKVQIKLEAIPRGAFLIHPAAVGIDDSPLVGERLAMTRSELVSQGHDKATVWKLRAVHEPRDPDSSERRGEVDDDNDSAKREVSKEMEQVQVWDCYVQLDRDGDGIAETHHIMLAEGGDTDKGLVILTDEPAPEVPYAQVVIEREAHQFEGHSVAEDLIDVQRTKTYLLRQTLDNLVWQNSPQPYVQLDAVMDVDAIYNPMPRKPVLLKSGRSAQEAVQWQPIPFMANDTFAMLDYFDKEAKERTGITDASGGFDPEQITGMTATAATLINDAGVAQSELMMRSLVRGIKKAFEGLLRLVVAHADQPRTVRLRGEWHEFDPRSWDAEMHFTVNVGLGAGSRERDLAMLTQILQLQQAIIAQAGPMNPLVKPEQLYNTLAKITETAGFPTADPYFTQPDPAEIQAMMEQAQQQPSEADLKAQELQMKAEAQREIEITKSQARSEVERSQMEADLVVEKARIEAEYEKQQAKLQSDAALARVKADHDAQLARMQAQIVMLQHGDKMDLEWAKLGQQREQARQQSLEGVAYDRNA